MADESNGLADAQLIEGARQGCTLHLNGILRRQGSAFEPWRLRTQHAEIFRKQSRVEAECRGTASPSTEHDDWRSLPVGKHSERERDWLANRRSLLVAGFLCAVCRD